jgi:fructokinase
MKWQPEWLYYGTLFSSSVSGRDVLRRLLGAVPQARRFYDLNLRPGCDSPELVTELLGAANVVKLNEEEAAIRSSIHKAAGKH